MSGYFVELNADQRREVVNTQQRFQALKAARARSNSYRGSMVWSRSRGNDYLLHAGYDKTGRRRQVSIGPRSGDTEAKKADFERKREEVHRSLAVIQEVILRQSAVNRVLGLGRVPILSAKIMRAIDASGLMGAGIRVLGTHALYAYEAAAGVHIEPGLTATGDVDLLFDARKRLAFIGANETEEASLLKLLQRIDRSFVRTEQSFRAMNQEGYLVDLIKPLRDPPWTNEATMIGKDPTDICAVEIAGLTWHESAPSFELVAIDENGAPLRIVTSDPRVYAAHKLWLSLRGDRDAVKRLRDKTQAECVASLVSTYLPQLPFSGEDLMMLPKDVVDRASPLFATASPPAP